MDDANRRLAQLAKSYGFTKKQNCYFRKKGDGILQYVKFEYERRIYKHELRIGLYSLYSELHPNWLTPSGCILRYPVIALSDNPKDDLTSPSSQIDILQEHGIQWLDTMLTQRNLVDAMCEIEVKENQHIMWNDSLKLAPFLVSGDFDSADRVISAILQQHLGPDRWTSQPWREEDFKIFKSRHPQDNSRLLQIHEWIRVRDSKAIEVYLKSNYDVNTNNLKLV